MLLEALNACGLAMSRELLFDHGDVGRAESVVAEAMYL